ncbi:TPA: hypothetical protein N0F65_001903 [Lagenidium giganteum]|uniref:Uncharacterized protein n=1 Tax=Lagenidium giganteum TaxID=4803 RepID=A0AAV2Z2E6_9STRA|nr:TPA: hypothetical protein N0F65_001903 [Lagenidium giganteum]
MTFIQAPRLKAWDQATLIKWFREWQQYITKIEHRCSMTGELYGNKVATVKGCIDPEVLTIMAGEAGGRYHGLGAHGGNQ